MSCLHFDASSQEGGVLGSELLNRFCLQSVTFCLLLIGYSCLVIFHLNVSSKLSLVKIIAGSMESCYFETRKVSAEVFNCFA